MVICFRIPYIVFVTNLQNWLLKDLRGSAQVINAQSNAILSTTATKIYNCRIHVASALLRTPVLGTILVNQF
ncbi:hypothetical protein J6590_061041 [Homalodisca vitripennis]|nr:hypothetical protein J6590_061041 [Homalodisca vitripennis]